ncbi:MAG: hypothetical protein K0S33_151 [Bacteroidetes bacterium]|jgi:hypothetical protein|nr:hypothetical protein [Bacteroidota bacterium]
MEKIIEPYYCEDAQIDVILPADRFYTDPSGDYLVIGYPGVDGIEFRLKTNVNDMTVYAFYPIGQEHIEIAQTPAELVRKWKEGILVL